MAERSKGALMLDFDGKLKVEFHGTVPGFFVSP